MTRFKEAAVIRVCSWAGWNTIQKPRALINLKLINAKQTAGLQLCTSVLSHEYTVPTFFLNNYTHTDHLL